MRILLVDDDRDSRAAVRWFLRDRDCDVTECSSGREALARLAEADYPMVLSDINMPGMTGLELAQAIRKLPDGWRTDVVLFTGYADLKSAVAALRAGAYDYLQKPVDAQELALTIERVSEHQALVRENRRLTESFREEVNAATAETRNALSEAKRVLAESVIGKVGVFGATTRSLLEQAERFHADRDIPVLIQGETGAGKEIVAKTIHFGAALDELSTRPFVDINCGAMAPTLFESEMFGYEAGAFTGGAARGAKGKLDMAQGGTIFFDEVGELPLELQTKLLRVLQEKEFYRVGGLKKIPVDIRVICATNVPLEEKVESGAFRSDLYYRLKVGRIVVPPLRERREEIGPLAEAFLLEAARQKKKRLRRLAPEAVRLLEDYAWPGNVRELKNLMEYAAFAFDEEELRPGHLAELIPGGPGAAANASAQAGRTKELVFPFPDTGYSLKSFTDDLIEKVIEAHGGNQSAAARYLGLTVRALQYRIEKARQKP